MELSELQTRRGCDLCGTFDLGFSFENMRGRIFELDLLCCRRCLKALTWEGLSVGQERAFVKHMRARGLPLPPRNEQGWLVYQKLVEIVPIDDRDET